MSDLVKRCAEQVILAGYNPATAQAIARAILPIARRAHFEEAARICETYLTGKLLAAALRAAGESK